MGILIFIVPLVLPPVGHVYMPVEEKSGLILVHQLQERLKPLMGQISPVVQLIGGGMGNQDVESPPPQKLEPQPRDPTAHSPLRVLIGPFFIAHGSAQSQDPDPLVYINTVVDADTA